MVDNIARGLALKQSGGSTDAKTLNGYTTDNGSNSVLLSGRKASTTIGANSIAEGYNTTASGYTSIAEGYNTISSGVYSHAEGGSTTASNEGCHSEGYNTSATGQYAHAEGRISYASGYASHAEGQSTASGNTAHAEGIYTNASGNYSHAEGYQTNSSEFSSHAEGYDTTASGYASHAEGEENIASAFDSHAEGKYTTASVFASHSQGQYNKALTGNATTYSATADAFVIGNGTSSSALSNAFRVTFDGKTYGLSAFNSTGADYSEYFEWLDGNTNNEDRVGKFVTLDGKKIKFANDGDYILGITSSTPSIIGDSASESWSNRYVTDIFGRIQYHDVAVSEKTITITNEDGTTEEKIISEAHTELQPIYNPNYDPTKEDEYINREKRKEWSTVGLLGKLIVIDDGTCEVNGYCKPSNGIAIKSTAGYRVMERLDNNHIMALIK